MKMTILSKWKVNFWVSGISDLRNCLYFDFEQFQWLQNWHFSQFWEAKTWILDSFEPSQLSIIWIWSFSKTVKLTFSHYYGLWSRLNLQHYHKQEFHNHAISWQHCRKIVNSNREAEKGPSFFCCYWMTFRFTRVLACQW